MLNKKEIHQVIVDSIEEVSKELVCDHFRAVALDRDGELFFYTETEDHHPGVITSSIFSFDYCPLCGANLEMEDARNEL